MRLSRTLSLILALMLAAALPLRGYAAMAQCEGSASAAAHAEHGAHCTEGAGSTHASGCSDCCCAASASTPARWIIPHAPTGEIIAPSLGSPPTHAPDRLDRPPRLPR
ncbi:MAG: hypothetical protein ABSD02_10885 [Steroidobacteraceae bacterium]